MNNWEVKKISEVANTFSGGTPSRTNQDYFIGEIPWVKSGELNDKFIFSTTEHINPESINNSSAKILPTNTLLVALYGETVGKTAILRIEAATNQAICAIISKDKSSFDSYYLQCQLIRNRSKLLAKRSGGAQPNISQEIIRNLEIPFPPLPEQKAIAEILSTVDEAIQKSDEAINRTEKLKREMMNKLLNNTNWQLSKIKDSKEIQIIMGQSPDSTTYNEEGNGIHFLQGKAEFGVKYPNPIKYTSNPIKLVEKDDILLSVRAPVGDVNLSPFELCIGRGLAGLRFKESLSLFYFYWFQKNKNFIESLGAGSTFKAITVEQIKRLELPLATINEQKDIVLILSDIDKKIEFEKVRRQKFINIKKSLMNDLLTGKKRMRIN